MPFVQPAPVDITRDSYSSVSRDSYGYRATHCEPVLQVIQPEKNWIVRNSYDSLVWISKDTPILDIDQKDQETVDAVIKACACDAAVDFRLYETCEGLRLIVTDWHLQIFHTEKDGLWEEGSVLWKWFDGIPIDPKYKRLCHEQQCFRARLGTKPWRSDGTSYLNQRPEHGFWNHAVSGDFAITRLITANDLRESVGQKSPIGLHDCATGALTQKTTLA